MGGSQAQISLGSSRVSQNLLRILLAIRRFLILCASHTSARHRVRVISLRSERQFALLTARRTGRLAGVGQTVGFGPAEWLELAGAEGLLTLFEIVRVHCRTDPVRNRKDDACQWELFLEKGANDLVSFDA